MNHLNRSVSSILLLSLVVLACAGQPTGTASPAPGGPTPSPRPSVTPAPSPTPLPSPSPGAVASPAQAAARVFASDPQFASMGPLLPDVIGQCCFYEAVEVADGYEVTIEIGWGDCQAGCINRHRWLFHVGFDGTINLLNEEGDEPLDAPPVGGAGPAGVVLRLVAGPTCPVETNPPDPNCAARPVANAEVVIRNGAGVEQTRAVSDADGVITLELPPGAYSIEPQAAEGLMGTPEQVALAVLGGDQSELSLLYDTGIR